MPKPQTRSFENYFVKLFDELRLPVYRYVSRTGLCPEEAEDITQEVFLRLFKHLLGQGREENLRGWIFRVARNLAIDRLRDRNRLRTKNPKEWEGLNDLLMDSTPNPEERLLGKERTARIDRAIRSLSHRQWQCLSLRLDGFVCREIGEILGVRVSTVTESLHRAIERLQGNEMQRPGRE